MRLTKLIICWFLLFFCSISVFARASAALELDKIRISFLSGDYKACIDQGENLLSATAEDAPGLDELYYILGLSYLKDGRYLRASDIFEIVLNEFKGSKFTDGARVGLGDTYFLAGDYPSARNNYEQTLKDDPNTALRPLVLYRLSQCAAKTGDTKTAADYLDKLKSEAPLILEMKSEPALVLPAAAVSPVISPAAELPKIYYTVQVGNFSGKVNAENLKNKLLQESYPAYMEETDVKGKTSYRVRVGKLDQRRDAQDLEEKLSRQGYPTKIFP